MSTVAVAVHSSKMLYATILKGLAIWEQIRMRRDILADMFPQISVQWDSFLKVISPCISRKVAVTASLSKADTVPDETRVPPGVDINAGSLRLMHRLAGTLGLGLSTDFEWFDEADRFAQAFTNWAVAANTYLEIEQLANDLTMHRAYGCDLYTSSTEQRTPGQLTFYNECNIPLADSIFASSLNTAGLQAGFGSVYLGWMTQSVEELVTDVPPVIETDFAQVTATPEDDPDNPGTQTLYAFAVPAGSIPDGWKLGGVVIAASPDLTAPAQFYSTMIYQSDTAGVLRIPGAFDGPDVPASVEFKLLLIRNL